MCLSSDGASCLIHSLVLVVLFFSLPPSSLILKLLSQTPRLPTSPAPLSCLGYAPMLPSEHWDCPPPLESV